jgi:TonB C terminal
MRSVISIIALCVCGFGAANSSAQTGPNPARVLNTTFRGNAAKLPSMDHWAVVQLRIAADGHLIDGKIVDTSGSEQFDREAVAGVSATLSGIPEIDANGTVLETGTVKLGYGNRARALVTQVDLPAPAVPVKTPEELAEAEGARIQRMHCKDFLWEYDLMRSLHARVSEERMPQTAMAIYASKAHLPATSVKKIAKVGKKGIPAIAEACRSQPDAMFVEAVLVPTFDALMK